MRRTATVDRRTSLLLEEVKNSYQLAWSEFHDSHSRATGRVNELFAAYAEYIRLVLGQAAKADAVHVSRDEGWDFVWTIDHPDSERTLELMYRVESISPSEVAGPTDAPFHEFGSADLENPFE